MGVGILRREIDRAKTLKGRYEVLGRVVNQCGGFTIAWSYDSLFNGQWRGL
jgi:hypothetical protein